jgi:hypothetical protein
MIYQWTCQDQGSAAEATVACAELAVWRKRGVSSLRPYWRQRQAWNPEYSGHFRLRNLDLLVVTLETDGAHVVSLAHVYTSQLLWS